jgi:hypothetical protein
VAIAKDLGISLPSVKRAVKSLAPYFKIDRRGRANEYRMGTKLIPIEADNRDQFDTSLVSKTTGIGIKDYPPSLEHPLKILERDAHTAKTGEGRARRKRQPRKQPSIGFPSSWSASDTSYAHGERLGFARAEIDRAAAKFRGHHIAKGSLFANWDQAFNNWLDKDAEWNRSPREATANGGFVGVPDSPAFDAWKTHATANSSDPKCRSLKRLLENYELSGKSFNFESEWPPGYQPTKKSNA